MPIPKIIINCWFGMGSKNALFEHCLRSQKLLSPDWLVIDINEHTLPPIVMDSPFFKGVLGRGEFVKATEFARLWGLWVYGGVYMDADVELLRPLDPLLSADDFFIGREDDEHINGAVMGSVARGRVIADLLRDFPLNTEGRDGAHSYGPGYLTARLRDRTDIVVHPPSVFYPSHWRTPENVCIKADTIAHHRWAKSWVGKY